MERRSPELWAALATIILITIIYLPVVIYFSSFPAASGLFGHGLGIVGFLLMLLTETLYSLRKRARHARWGRMSLWLQLHIFTGLVGPYMVLLHSAWKFNGVAAMAMLLTLIVVASGFIGRYIYTAVPRTADGIEMEAEKLRRQITLGQKELQQWLAAKPEMVDTLAQRLNSLAVVPQNALGLIWGRTFLQWRYRFQWQQEKRRLQAMGYTHLQELDNLLERHRTLQRQVDSLAMVRQLLALWHSMHVPLGVSLFTLAFIHIGAALYYATLLK